MAKFKKTHLSWPTLSLAFIVAISLLTFGPRLLGRPHPAKHAREVVEIPGPEFAVRISAFPEENGGPVAGAYYRFESLPSSSKNWVTSMEFRHDDPVPIPRENVRFMPPKSAYVFMGWKYAVTTDGGEHWRLWNAETDLAGWRCCNYGLIQQVELEQNGAGKMRPEPNPGPPG